MGYVTLFLLAFGVNLLPAFGPPTWSIIVLYGINGDQPLWALVVVGALGGAVDAGDRGAAFREVAAAADAGQCRGGADSGNAAQA